MEGVARLSDVRAPLTERAFHDSLRRHHVAASSWPMVVENGWLVPWVLSDVSVLAEPVPFVPRPGVVTWVSLDDEVISRIRRQLEPAHLDRVRCAGPPPAVREAMPTQIERSSRAADPGRHVAGGSARMGLRVPFARDGSWFGPHLARRDGSFTSGEKGREQKVHGFEEALRRLAGMSPARWRRPNRSGNWGIVSGIDWKEPPS